MKRFLRGVFFGSPDGPAIVIHWERQEIQILRAPPWLARALAKWLFRGELEKLESK